VKVSKVFLPQNSQGAWPGKCELQLNPVPPDQFPPKYLCSPRYICGQNGVGQYREKEGLINKVKHGREFVIELTEVGKEVLEIIKKYDIIAMEQIEKSKSNLSVNNQQSEKEVKNGTT